MAKRDYYEVLGVSRDSSLDDIKKSFRKLSREFHPDMQHGKTDAEKKTAEEKFKEIAEAYEILSDESKRKQYDQFGFSGPQGFGGQGVDLGEFFRKHSSMFGEMFGGGSPFGSFSTDNFGNSWFGFNGNASGRHNKDLQEDGRDVRVKMNISLRECIFGTTREFDLPINRTCHECNGNGKAKDSTEETCPDCRGQGMVTEVHKNGFMILQISHPCGRCHGAGVINKSPCPKCGGNGRIQEKSHFIQRIPSGIRTGETIVVKDAGEGGRNGGSNGNLIIVLEVEQSDKFFFRKESSPLDLHSKSYVSPLVSLFGGKIEVITPYGVREIQLPSGTENGKIVKVEGCGIKSNNKTGDLYVELVFDNLEYLKDADIKALREIHSHVGRSNLKNQRELIEKFKTWQ